ncbi:uncharacterized protein LOC109846150 [Asparagus officinalis]|uniref:uncharacterized protein LOC109846150 n=1 Tax=Asparagus officinalis TaxID=4686 RepID=UPI00098E2714|nr:uncharacterized protein LOC109846150 [Asparagus officinalis]
MSETKAPGPDGYNAAFVKSAWDIINGDLYLAMKEFLNTESFLGLRFSSIMINWIMEYISSPKYTLELNGSLHGYFKGWNISKRLNALRNDNLFKYHPNYQCLGITHLIFADELLLFAKADGYSIMKLFNCLQEFSRVSGLEANPAKCSIYFSGVDDGLKNQICSFLNFPEGMLPIRYLGLPFMSKRLSYLDCSPLISKISEQFPH